MCHVAQTRSRGLNIVTIASFLAGCAAPRQYQTAVNELASEECRALQAVMEERERYGIVASSRGLDEEALRQCGLPHSSGGGPPFPPTHLSPPPVRSPEIKIERRCD